MYVRVAHDGSVPAMYDPCHPIIDNVFFEFTGVTATNQGVAGLQTGDFGRSTIDLVVNAICAQGYNGTDCNTFCEEIDGTLTCREDEIMVPTTSTVVNPTSSETICMTDPTSSQTNSVQETDDTSTSSQTSTSSSVTVLVSTSGLSTQRSDNILAIAVGVGVGGAVFLCLLVGLIILLLCLVCRVRRNKQKSKQLILLIINFCRAL